MGGKLPPDCCAIKKCWICQFEKSLVKIIFLRIINLTLAWNRIFGKTTFQELLNEIVPHQFFEERRCQDLPTSPILTSSGWVRVGRRVRWQRFHWEVRIIGNYSPAETGQHSHRDIYEVVQ